MGFFTRLLAGLVAASTLGAGLAGTAGAADSTGTNVDGGAATAATVANTTNTLSDHLVNSDFEYLPDGGWKTVDAPSYMRNAYTSVDPNNGQYMRNAKHVDADLASWVDWPGFDQSKFAWKTDQKGGHDQGGLKDRANAVELQQDSTDGNTYAEMVASETGRTIYQNLATIPGTLYKIRLKHASLCKDNVDQMQVVINGTPIEMTRVAANGKAGDKVGEKSTTIGTRVTNENRWHHSDQWETYEGYYVIPDGQTATRFGFKAVNYLDPTKGNLLDDVTFARAYKLSYDKNSTDATGEVPSNQRGKENTVEPAESKTNGTVKTVADENVRYGSLANGDFSYPSFSDIQKNEQETHADLRTFLKSDDGTLWHNMSATDLSKYGKIGQIPGFDSSRFAWSSTENGSRVELQQDRNTKNTYAEIVAQQDNTSIYQNVSTGNGGVLYKIRLKHASRQSSHADRMQVLVGSDTDHATPVEMTRVTSNGHGDKVGGKSTTITTKVSNTDPRDHGAQWETYEGYYQVPEGQKNTVFMFKSLEGFKEVETLPGNNIGNLVDDIEFSRSYKLTYDANSSDASGQVPSDTAANTVKQAKASTTGTLRLASDDDVATYAASNLPEQIVNGGFDYPSVPSWTALPESGSNKYNKGKLFATINPGTGKYGSGCAMSTTGRAIPNWNRLNFAWNSTQGDTHYSGGMSCEAGNVELNYDSVHHNQFAELTADQQGTAIYQDVKVTPGTMMKWSLKHSSATSAYVDKMQVMIGEPYKETAQEATRITSENGNKVGEKMTTISTPTTSDRADNKKWDTYSGTYLVPDGVTTVRFTFKSVASAEWYSGNDLDDIEFSRSYKLTYDKNSSDAAGEVPSNQRGKENTVQPAKSKTTGTVKTVVDTSDGLPTELVNGDFEYPGADVLSQNLRDKKRNWWGVSRKDKMVYESDNPTKWVSLPSTFDSDRFAWDSSEAGKTSGVQEGSSQWHTNEVELQRDSRTGNMYAELSPYQAQSSIRQYIRTTPGALYKVRLKHASLSSEYLDKMQVLIGADGNEQPVRMTRVESQNGLDAIGESTASTTISTHASNKAEISWGSGLGYHSSRNHHGQWATYEGVYVATSDVTVFTFKSVDSPSFNTGNLLDDVVFTKAYKLTYDKNSADASGEVPSNQRGRENTTQPAKAKTTGTVRTVTDKTSDGLTVHDLKNGEIAPVQYGDFKFSTIDGVTADQITDVNGFTVKTNWNPTVENQAYAGTLLGTMYQPNKNGASLVLHHVGQWRDSSGTQRWLNAKITVNGQNLGSLVYYESQHKFLASYGKWDRHTSSRPYMDVTVDFLLDDGSTPQGLRGVTGFTDLDGGTSGYNEGVELVSGFDGAYVRSDAHLARFGTNGWAGATDENENNADAHGMKHYVGATFTGSSFHVRWSVASGQARGSGFQPVDSTIAYRLTYDKNAQDATGSIPSDTAANTTQPAKSETDGKVSDLVQRTTTHEDGSVTVRTVDQSTDVVSGCQVYYPAGQRITLATLAKDGDCWDSSMLTRPGHTQLGWSQDSQATQAQAEVTMVEGGMTVYAVWVGNPVLTYDTNKPNTWNGQMPSTPASVSVAYNTAAADGSGWQSGDTSKIRGYRFLGWYAGPQDDAGLYDWNTPLTGNVTVYAHWERLKANVVYDRNAKDAKGSHANTTGWQYSDVTVPSDTSKSFKRAGYVFLGWDTQADGNGTAYKDGSQVPLQDKDITLYAQWQPVFEQFTPTGGVSLPLLVAGGVTLLVMGIGSTVMLTRRMRGEQ